MCNHNIEKFAPVPGTQLHKLDMIWRVNFGLFPIDNSVFFWFALMKPSKDSLSGQVLTNMNWPWTQSLVTTKLIFHCVEQARGSRLTALSQSSAPPYLKSSNMKPSEDSLSEQVLTNMNWPWSWFSWCISILRSNPGRAACPCTNELCKINQALTKFNDSEAHTKPYHGLIEILL